MSDWKTDIVRLRAEGTPWKDIIDKYKDEFPGLTPAQLRRKFLNYYVRRPIEAPPQKSSNGWSDGQYTSDRLIEICETEKITPELILSLHGLNGPGWEVVRYTNNYWHSQIKGGQRLVMYQSKLIAKPIASGITFEDIEAYFKDKVYPTPPLVQQIQYDPNGETLEIDIADLHSGLLAWGRETGADYDVHIAKERFIRVISDSISRCEGRTFKKVIFALLGDLLHIDNDQQTTTKGTFQQSDGRTPKIFEVTIDMLFDAIQMLGKIAPVDVVYTSGNHDGVSGWMLIKGLQMGFRNDQNISIDIEPNPQKTRLINNTLIGFVHGDMPEKNLSGWLQVQARKLPVSIRFMEVHTGHRHAQKVKEHIQTVDNEGVVVRTMPTITSSSSWEHREGYAGATCTSMSFVWHDEYGLREMWYCNI